MANTAIIASVLAAAFLGGCTGADAGSGEKRQVTSDCPEPDIEPGTYLFVHVSNGTAGIAGATVSISSESAPAQQEQTPWYGCAIFQVEPGLWSGTATYGGQEETFTARVAENEIERVVVAFWPDN